MLTQHCWVPNPISGFFSKNRIRTSHHGPSVRLNPFGLFLRRAFYLKWRMQCKKILILFTELKLFQCWLRRFIQIGWYVRSRCPCMVPKDTQLFNPRIENLGVPGGDDDFSNCFRILFAHKLYQYILLTNMVLTIPFDRNQYTCSSYNLDIQKLSKFYLHRCSQHQNRPM